MEYVAALAPTAGVVFLFWLAFRAIFRADRAERAAVARHERESAKAHDGSGNGADSGAGSGAGTAAAGADDRRDA